MVRRMVPEWEALRAAAMEYPAHGWGVLPGSVWNGQCYTLGHTPTPVEGLEPVMLSGRTFRSAREVWSWWSVAPYAVLARAGEDFDVLTAPSELVSEALEQEHGAVRSCPVTRSPDGRVAGLLVQPHSRLRWELHRVRGVTLLSDGVLVPLPPTRTAEGEWSWWRAPIDGYRLGLAGAVQRALRDASATLRSEQQARLKGERC